MDITGPTLYMEYRSVPSQMSLTSAVLPGRLSCSWINWAKDLIRLALPPTHTNYKKILEIQLKRLGIRDLDLAKGTFYIKCINLFDEVLVV